MTRPRSVVVMGQTFDIEYVDDGDLRLGGHIGRMRLKDQRLYIGAGQAFHQERDTVLHEVLHIATNLQNLVEDEKEDERTVARLTPVLLEILRHNPELVAYLVDDA